MSTHPQHVLWIDLETTDTDPFSDVACILEIGAVVTDWTPELNVVAEASMLIRPPGLQSDHDFIWARMNPVIRDMHHGNGLWAEATTSDDAWLVHEADQGITRWVVEHVGDEAVPLAGSGVGHLDLPFIKRHLPMLATRLTYWPLDIGGQRRMLQLAGRGDHVDLPTDVDAKPHRGLDDVRLHITEARRYLKLLGRLPAAEPASRPPVLGVAVQP